MMGPSNCAVEKALRFNAIAEGQLNMGIVSTDSGAVIRPPPALDSVVVRFAGDSGDGMQLTGGRFTLSTALAGNDLATFPDFPAERRRGRPSASPPFRSISARPRSRRRATRPMC